MEGDSINTDTLCHPASSSTLPARTLVHVLCSRIRDGESPERTCLATCLVPTSVCQCASPTTLNTSGEIGRLTGGALVTATYPPRTIPLPRDGDY